MCVKVKTVGFKDGNTNDTDYEYWNDGSLKSDANKGITLIEYDTYLKKGQASKFYEWQLGKVLL